MKSHQWQKLILRWSPLHASPEVRLISAVIAQAIEDCTNRAMKSFSEPSYKQALASTSIPSYCSLIGVDFTFLTERCEQAFAAKGGI